MTMPRSRVWILLVGSLAAPAAAQDAGDFAQLLGLIESGDDIRVALTGDGLVRAAQVVGLTPAVLSVRIQGQHLDLDRGAVLSVRYGVDDPTRDGAWRGFAAGAAGGLLMSYAMCTGLDLCPTPPASVLLVAGLFGAAGAWIGVGLDRLTQTEVRWPATNRGAWRVAPLLAPDRRGVAVALRF
ncbi:MAG: hypothetical protein OXG35_14630 [Acidobacteria bacterium]|nr:hypothetical protein [Acidobacteriota bacterium]